jgi:Reverse transcriptase (RNA-dependent DNA polymerase)
MITRSRALMDDQTSLSKEELPNGRKLIGNRWVFAEKRNGVYRARLVALGYSQVAGVDFKDNFSPVFCDTSFRIVLLLIQKLKLPAWSIDVETAFLNGNLNEENYICGFLKVLRVKAVGIAF